jgi:hypothetical protein
MGSPLTIAQCAAEVANKITYVALSILKWLRDTRKDGIISWSGSRSGPLGNRPDQRERPLAKRTPRQLLLQPCSLRTEIGAIWQCSGCVVVTLPSHRPGQSPSSRRYDRPPRSR